MSQQEPPRRHLLSIEVEGFRGFAATSVLHLGIPDGVPGSGLTILVGPNSGGKTSFLEALTAVTQHETHTVAFSEGQRNRHANGQVRIQLAVSDGSERTLKTVEQGGAYAELNPTSAWPTYANVYSLPARRTFVPFFGGTPVGLDNYRLNWQKLSANRGPRENFTMRLMSIIKDKREYGAFNALARRVCPYFPNWTIELSDQGGMYLRCSSGLDFHSSDGLGEGLVSLLFIIDALNTSKPGDIISIDEPELSLHPALQRNLLQLLIEYSADRQILIATHSPLFISWEAIVANAEVVRLINSGNGTQIYRLSSTSRNRIRGFLCNDNNPHILGLNANEVFFLNDGVLLTEGQEDVLFYPRVFKQLKVKMDYSFYGWGAGSADNMDAIALLLDDLGFKRVAGLLDGNKTDKLYRLSQQFPHYKFCNIPADDLRGKQERTIKPVRGLLDESKAVRPEYVEDTKKVLRKISEYLSSRSFTKFRTQL